MKKFLSILIAVCVGMGICADVRAENPAKPRGWGIVPSNIASDRPYFLLKFNGVEIGTLTPTLKSTAASLSASQNAAKWFVSYFKLSDQDIDSIEKALKNEGPLTWSVKTTDGVDLPFRGWKGGVGHGISILDTLQMTFKPSIKRKEKPEILNNLSRLKEYIKGKNSMNNFLDSQSFLKSEYSANCHECFNFERIGTDHI
jgi:hypothetical protein